MPSKIILIVILAIFLKPSLTFTQTETLEHSSLSSTLKNLKTITSYSGEEDEIREIQELVNTTLRRINDRKVGHVENTINITADEILIRETLKAFEVAANPDIQMKDKIKLPLIRLCTSLFDLTFYETTLIGREFYDDTLNKISDSVHKMKGKLPATQIEAGFLLTRCAELINFLELNPSKHFKDAYTQARAMSVENLVKLVPNLYKSKVKSWFIDFLYLDWLALAVRDAGSFRHYLEKDLAKILKNNNGLFRRKVDDDYVIGCCLILIELMERNDGTIDLELKKKIVGGYFYHLINHSSWKVRYLVIEYMLQLLNNGSEYNEHIDDNTVAQIEEKIENQAASEKNPHVKNLVKFLLLDDE